MGSKELGSKFLQRSQICSHTPSALNAGAKRSGATCHMAMPQCCYLAKGAKRPSHTTNTLKFDRIPFDPCNSIKRFDLCPFDQKNSTYLQPPGSSSSIKCHVYHHVGGRRLPVTWLNTIWLNFFVESFGLKILSQVTTKLSQLHSNSRNMSTPGNIIMWGICGVCTLALTVSKTSSHYDRFAIFVPARSLLGFGQ